MLDIPFLNLISKSITSPNLLASSAKYRLGVEDQYFAERNKAKQVTSSQVDPFPFRSAKYK
jgi:hypothetical protein